MSPRAGELLLDVIQPMLIAVVPQVVRTTGAEDSAELVQDGMCMAVQAIEVLENQGKDLMPRSVAYYTIQRLKSGRRSQYTGRMDAMCPGATLDKKVVMADMDSPAPVEDNEMRSPDNFVSGRGKIRSILFSNSTRRAPVTMTFILGSKQDLTWPGSA